MPNLLTRKLSLCSVAGDQCFDKGIGMRGRCRVTYRLDTQYSWFEATAGLDPSAGGKGRARLAALVDGKEHPVGADDVELVMQPLEGYRVVRSGTHAVALNLGVDDELVREGLAREVVHAVQSARKAAGLEVEDRISLVLGGDRELLEAVRAHEDYVVGETLATPVAYRDGTGAGEPIRIGDRELFIAVERA